MYLPKHFAVTDLASLHGLILAQPLATVISTGEDGLDANHIPLDLVPTPASYGRLHGHLARANPLANAGMNGQEVLALFHGPQHYISPSGYATKAEHGKVVPTWNYVAVHAWGTVRLIDDRDWIFGQINGLTTRLEAGLAQPWAVSDAPADYLDKMVGAIVGIEITITRLLGKWKVSQNQPAVNQVSLSEALAQTNNEMAALVRRHAE